MCWRHRLKGISLNAAAAAVPPIVHNMPRTKNVPRRCEGDDPAVRDQQRGAAARAAAPAPAPRLDALQARGAGAFGVTVKEEEEVEEKEEEEEDTTDRLGPARIPASGPRAALAAAPAPAPDHGAPAARGVGAFGVDAVVGGGQIGGGKCKRVKTTAAVALPAPLIQLAASAPPPRSLPPPPQHVDMKWVEGQGERCTRSCRKPSGNVWRCSSAAVPGRPLCAHHGAKNTTTRKPRVRLRRDGAALLAQVRDGEEGDGVEGSGGSGGSGGGERSFTSTFRGVSKRSSGRWNAMFKCHGGKSTYLGTFDREKDAARAWDRMMVWCHLHGVALIRPGGGSAHTSDSIKAALNIAYEEYAGEVDGLRGVLSEDAMVQKLRQEGRAQSGSRKRKRANGRAGALPAEGGGGAGGGDGDGRDGDVDGGGGGGGNMDGDVDVDGS